MQKRDSLRSVMNQVSLQLDLLLSLATSVKAHQLVRRFLGDVLDEVVDLRRDKDFNIS